MSSKGAGPSLLEGRSSYVSTMVESPKFGSNDYVSSAYAHKSNQLYSDKTSDYPSIDRRQYGDRASAYIGRDLQSEPTGRYADSVSFPHQHQVLSFLCLLLLIFFLFVFSFFLIAFS